MEPVVRLTVEAQGRDLRQAGDVACRTAECLEAALPNDLSLFGVTARKNLSLAGCIARLALLLQQEFGYDLEDWAILEGTTQDDVEIVYAYADPGIGIPAGRLAVALTDRAVGAVEKPDAGTVAGQLAESFQRAVARLRPLATYPPTRRTLWEADRRGIPWSRVPYSDSIMQLGQGHKRRRFRNSYWHETSHLATRLAISKAASGELLRSNGIPTPQHKLVYTAEEALAAAAELGYPVVVKPNGRDMATAVSINLGDEAAVRKAYAKAQPHGPVLVEKQIPGSDYRITVLHGRMIAAGRYCAAFVVGDAKSTIHALIASANRDPRRGRRDCNLLKLIEPDAGMADALARQGLGLDSVPEAGRRVALREWWRDAGDFCAEDVTSQIHQANRVAAERAARLVGLDLAGIDFITPDISRPWHEVGGVVNEINPTPGLNAHLRADGAPDVHRIIVEEFFPPGDDGRIPLGVLLTAPGAAEVVCLVGRLLDTLGHRAMTATSEGVRLGDEVVSRSPGTGVAGAEMAFADPLCTAAVLEVCDRTAEFQGLGFDRASVVALMQAPRCEAAARLLFQCARDFVVLDADLPAVAKLADSSGAKRVLWVTRAPQSDRVAKHVTAGGAAVVLDEAAGDSDVLLWDAGDCHPLCRFGELAAEPELSDGNGVLFAVAIAYGLTRSAQEIARCLGSNQDRHLSAERTSR